MANSGLFSGSTWSNVIGRLVALYTCFAGTALLGASINLTPCADTSLMEVAETNSNGGQTFFQSGMTQNGKRNRGLLKFDLSSIPTNAGVISASLTVSVTHKPADDFAIGLFSLHKMLKSWGEGTNVALPNFPGQGEPADIGDATWLHRSFPASEWGSPGGADGTDYVPWESAFQTIYGPSESPFVFESTPELVADVQSWIGPGAVNYGWMIICNDELTPFTARRFGSKEDPAHAPVLSITYVIRPVLCDPTHLGGSFAFWFFAEPSQSYTIEAKTLNGSWKVVSTIPASSRPRDVYFNQPCLQGGSLFRVQTQ